VGCGQLEMVGLGRARPWRASWAWSPRHEHDHARGRLGGTGLTGGVHGSALTGGTHCAERGRGVWAKGNGADRSAPQGRVREGLGACERRLALTAGVRLSVGRRARADARGWTELGQTGLGWAELVFSFFF
jgi:hypothetical protein